MTILLKSRKKSHVSLQKHISDSVCSLSTPNSSPCTRNLRHSSSVKFVSFNISGQTVASFTSEMTLMSLIVVMLIVLLVLFALHMYKCNVTELYWVKLSRCIHFFDHALGYLGVQINSSKTLYIKSVNRIYGKFRPIQNTLKDEKDFISIQFSDFRK